MTLARRILLLAPASLALAVSCTARPEMTWECKSGVAYLNGKRHTCSGSSDDPCRSAWCTLVSQTATTATWKCPASMPSDPKTMGSVCSAGSCGQVVSCSDSDVTCPCE